MYLLLRNNKQSGPYSVDDLKSMGLKAYDLVWLEGKSAAWRYPCEIEELSAFAPPVEEQPFDRFYKKPVAAAKPAEDPIVTAKSIAEEPVSIVMPPAGPMPAEAPAPALPLYTGEPSTVPGKRIIYVTMPAGRNTASPAREARETQSSVVRETPAKEPVRESVRPATPDPLHAAYASGPGYTTANANHRVEDYSSQLPSLEEQLEAVSPRRKRKEYNARIVRPLAIGATVLAVLAAGIFIGLSLNRNATGVRQTIASKNPAENTNASIAHPVSQQLPVSATSPALTAATIEKPADSLGTAPGKGADGSRTSVPPVVKPVRAALKERAVTPRKNAASPPAAKDSAAGSNAHREAVHRADIVESKPETKPVDKEAVRASVSSQVSVGANGYNVGTFGGINDLQLTVTNRSIYPLDLVVVEVQYIQANKKVYKTENLYFRNIAAGSALMQEAPKSSRGIKVQYKITTISPRA